MRRRCGGGERSRGHDTGEYDDYLSVLMNLATV
jgi:hypothetical protein